MPGQLDFLACPELHRVNVLLHLVEDIGEAVHSREVAGVEVPDARDVFGFHLGGFAVADVVITYLLNVVINCPPNCARDYVSIMPS